MKAFLLIPVAAALLVAGCSQSTSSTKSSTATNTAANTATSTSANTTPNYGGVLGQAQKYSVGQIDLAQLTQAVQQYNAVEGHYPKNLQDLIPNYLAKMPTVPAGYRISYDANTGKVKVVKQ